MNSVVIRPRSARDLTDSLQGGVYSQVVDTHSAREHVPVFQRSTRIFSATPQEAASSVGAGTVFIFKDPVLWNLFAIRHGGIILRI